MSWETTVRTGHPSSDAQAVEGLRRQAEAQGMTLAVTPMPQGGLHVRAVPRPTPHGYGAPAQAPQAHAYAGAPFANQAHQAPHGGHSPYGAPSPAYGGPQPAYGGPVPAIANAYAGHAPAGGSLTNEANLAYAENAGGEARPLGSARVAYLRKVYGLLAGAAFVAIGTGAAAIYLSPTESVDMGDGTTLEVPLVAAILLQFHFVAFALLFVATLVAGWVSRVRVLNVIALFGVSALMGLELAPMAFVAQVLATRGETLTANPVRDTFVMVGGIFGVLTAYVFVTKKDFSYLKATLAMGFWVVLAAAILAFALGSEPFSLAVASVGALLSIGFLLYQTSHIFRNSRMDDAVGDALGLIVQLRNLFVFLLRIFMSRR
jgi:FtsH-binding integral membrane protein